MAMLKNMLKNVLKFLGIGLLIVVLGLAVLLAVRYMRYRTSPEYQVEQNLKNLEKQYAEDPYGGNTPEETLRLFIDALKKGDTDLAAKYFVLDKQEQWREELAKIKDKGLLNEMVKDLERLKKTKQTEEETFYTLADSNKVVLIEMILDKNQMSSKWKISEL